MKIQNDMQFYNLTKNMINVVTINTMIKKTKSINIMVTWFSGILVEIKITITKKNQKFLMNFWVCSKSMCVACKSINHKNEYDCF